jgi:hypothetical protein
MEKVVAMNEMQIQLLINLGVYIFIFFGAIILMQLLSRGLLFKYMRVRARRKTSLIMEIKGVTGTYFKVGKIKESKLYWTSMSGDKCSAPLDYSFISDFAGVPRLKYDEVNNEFVKEVDSIETLSGLDPVKVDIMVERAYLLGQLANQKAMLILMVIVGIVGLLTIVGLYFGYKNYQGMQTLLEQVATISQNVAVKVLP